MMDLHQSSRYRILVTADDFGISPRANRNTRYLLSLGKIDRIGIMAYGDFSEKEIDELLHSGVKLDIHLDILHKFNEDRARRSGTFFRMVEFMFKYLSRQITTKKVEQQWRDQIEKFRQVFGKNPDGISSHEHVHFFPAFFKIALKLEAEYSIPYIRFGESSFAPYSKIIAHVLHWLRTINKRACQKAGCVSSGFFVSLDWIKNIEKFLNNLPEGTIEVACHPEIAEEFVLIKKYF